MSASYMRGCAGKKRCETKAEAHAHRAALLASPERKSAVLTVYPCEQCLGYHVGGGSKIFSTRTRRPGKRANKRMRGR